MNDATAGTTRRQLAIWALAIASATAAVIHFAVAGEHFQEYWVFGVFMLVTAWLQLSWAVAIVARPAQLLLASGAVLNGLIVAVYLVTRTVGDVIGPTPNELEPVGFGDAFCTACEVVIVVGALVVLARPLTKRLPRAAFFTGTGAVGAVAATLLSVSLVAGGPEMVMSATGADAPVVSAHRAGMAGMAARAAVSRVRLTTSSPAGPVVMPDASMEMMPGMKMATGPCTATPTSAQQAATVKLVNTTWAAARKYRSLAAARAAGFQPLTPTGMPVVHYINVSNYVKTAVGGPVIDPAAPQSLVYANTPHGAVLAAVMYIESPHPTVLPPDPGGCLTQWHIHTNLCFANERVIGIKNPTCPAGSVNRVTQPMMHVWFVPIPGGPTAIDATDAQIVRAAEKVPSPRNGKV